MTSAQYQWRAVLALCALVFTGTACGGDADAPAPEADAAADAAAEAPADPATASGAGDELFGTNFGQVCRGTGQARAAAYVAGPGVHPVFVMRSDDGTEYHEGTVTLPEGWSTQWPDLERTELVVCARQVAATPGELCEGYSDDDTGLEWTVQTHAVTYEYTVRVARTAEELTRSTFEVPAGSCPMFSSYREGDPQPQPYYPNVGDGEVELLVRPFVTGS